MKVIHVESRDLSAELNLRREIEEFGDWCILVYDTEKEHPEKIDIFQKQQQQQHREPDADGEINEFHLTRLDVVGEVFRVHAAGGERRDFGQHRVQSAARDHHRKVAHLRHQRTAHILIVESDKLGPSNQSNMRLIKQLINQSINQTNN